MARRILAVTGTALGLALGLAQPGMAQSDQQWLIPQQTGQQPMSYIDADNNLTGFSPALSSAVGEVLGITLVNEPSTFENSLIGLQSGKYTAVPAANVSRERLKTYDFATSMRDSYTFFTVASGPDVGSSMDDLCGHSVALLAGLAVIPDMEEQAAKCAAAGKPELKIMSFPDYPTALLAVKSGRAELGTNGTNITSYQFSQPGSEMKITGPTYHYTDVGFASMKGNGVAEQIAKAVSELIANGTYSELQDKFGVSKLTSITESVVNPTPEH
jgi:polar amino acid transport system substrate-binding protein